MVQVGNYNQLELEKEVLDFWKEHSTYQKAKEKNKGKKQWYFLDGPPYTSGKVHIGTAWNKSLKDAIVRYKRMRGLDVWDRAGYDMHGLPTENATQKKLGLKTKEDILRLGIPKFIEECKKLCVENLLIMNEDFKRLGVWMDFDNAYQSVKKEFMDGEWWLIKQAHEKGRLYEGLRTMTWCANTESSLAKHELEYKTVKDNSIFVKFKVKGAQNEYLIIWTTTPWTIPFNLAVMVNPEVDYVKAQVGDEVWIVAGILANVFISGVAEKQYKIVGEMKGSELEGLEYTHPFQKELGHHYDGIKKKAKKTHTVLLSEEYVNTDGGTGLVHCAPGCGPEDYEVGHENGIPAFNNIDPKGIFPEEMGKFAGLKAKRDDKRFIEALDEEGALVAQTVVEHEYPHDWRFHEPVIFRTTKQWFFRIEDLKDKMVESNKEIQWVPKAAFNAFDSWLKNLRDNSISKQRYWGTPLPIWRNVDDEKDYIVIGSSQELEELSGEKVTDLHMSSIDHIEIKKGNKTYRRIPDVLDVWVDAGTVSWNCLDYPHKKENFHLFPADFILEGKDQIRGWFNLLMVASTIAFDKPSFKACYMHGFVDDALGRKMSKSAGNYIVPEEVISKYGADTLRYYTIGGANPGVDLNYNFDDLVLKYRNLGVLWNTHKYLIEMARLNDLNPVGITDVKIGQEEKYMISKTQSAIQEVTQMFESYRLNEVPLKVEELFLELSRTYIKMVRDKASAGTLDEKKTVLRTMYDSLMASLTLFAPIAPFISEKIYQNLKEEFSLEAESIHLTQWPTYDEACIDKELEEEMDIAKDIIQAVLAGREKAQMGVRWPLKKVSITSKEGAMEAVIKNCGHLIESQTNVKEIVLDSSMKAEVKMKPDYNKMAPDFQADTSSVIAKLVIESQNTVLSHIEKNGYHPITINGKVHKVELKHFIVEKILPENIIEMPFPKGTAYIDTSQTPELLAEGFAREMVRRIQDMRKKAGLQKQDEIAVSITAHGETKGIIENAKESIAKTVGAKRIEISERPDKEKALQGFSSTAKEGFKIKEHAVEIEIGFNKG